jgi:hypothetical protein
MSKSSRFLNNGRGRGARWTARLVAFNIVRLDDIFGGQFSQPHLRFAVTDIVSVPLTFGGLISQIDGAWGH